MRKNNNLYETIREDMLEGLLKNRNVINIERYLLDYVNKLNALELVKKYDCTLSDAIDTIDRLKKSNEVKKIITTLE